MILSGMKSAGKMNWRRMSAKDWNLGIIPCTLHSTTCSRPCVNLLRTLDNELSNNHSTSVVFPLIEKQTSKHISIPISKDRLRSLRHTPLRCSSPHLPSIRPTRSSSPESLLHLSSHLESRTKQSSTHPHISSLRHSQS